MMKKEYINPTMEIVELKTKGSILVGSDVKTGGTPGDEFNENDESY